MKDADFRPAWWIPGPHLQTLFPHLFRQLKLPALRRERLELDDGDFLDLDYTEDQTGPLVLLLHGLEGSRDSHYVRGLLNSLPDCGLQTVLFNFRSCSGEPNRLPRSYHSGETGDLGYVLTHLRHRFPQRRLFAVGISLGGNVLLKWLGEQSRQTDIERAIAISVPFRLDLAAERMQRGLSRFYQKHLLTKLRQSLRLKSRLVEFPVELEQLEGLNTFRKFDDRVTAPLHGFDGVDDYYRRSSSRSYLHAIQTPTLIIHADDDPFMTADATPEVQELSPSITLELTRSGGHVGFVSGRIPGRPDYWLDKRCCRFFHSS